MPIHCYFGPPGSGKTYELVNRVIVEAVKQGRTVYHNIPGINADEWAGEFGCDPGSIRYVSDSWFTDETNFPANDEEFAAGVGVLKGGELIICDEASTIVPRGTGKNSPVSPRIDSFLRKHRHFTADVKDLKGKTTRLAVDLYYATQDSQSLYQTILHLTALRVDFDELKAVFGRGAYRAVVYKSHRATKANRWGNPKLRRTDKKGYVRYHSFAGGVDGSTAITEDTVKIWTKSRIALCVLIGTALVVGIVGSVKTVSAIMLPEKVDTSPKTIVRSVKTAAPVQARDTSNKFDPTAQRNGECLQSLVDVESRSYFDGDGWKQVSVKDGRWILGTCSIVAPRG